MAVPRSILRISIVASLVFGATGIGSASLPGVAHAEVPAVRKIAVVDLQRILNETKAGKNARQSLEASSKAKQRKLEKKQADMEAEVQKAQGLSGQQLAAAQERLQQQYVELQQMMYTLQQDLAQQEAKLLETMYSNSQKIVAKLARERDYDLVLVKDPGTMIHVRDAYDITNEVVSLYNKAHSK